MRCTRIEKLLSDKIDGVLSRRKEKKLESHLLCCQKCRSYLEDLEKLSQVAGELEVGKVEDNYWQSFTSRIKQKVISFRTERRKQTSYSGLRWAWIGASLVFIFLLSISLLHFRPERNREFYAFSYEDTLQLLYQDAGENINLGDLIENAILDSIEHLIFYPEESSLPGMSGLINPWDEFTVEEINLILSGGKKNES
ncbi:MAG: zf-HC2 domain-containing protein [Candidatus Aminicenantales bacterium]